MRSEIFVKNTFGLKEPFVVEVSVAAATRDIHLVFGFNERFNEIKRELIQDVIEKVKKSATPVEAVVSIFNTLSPDSMPIIAYSENYASSLLSKGDLLAKLKSIQKGSAKYLCFAYARPLASNPTVSVPVIYGDFLQKVDFKNGCFYMEDSVMRGGKLERRIKKFLFKNIVGFYEGSLFDEENFIKHDDYISYKFTPHKKGVLISHSWGGHAKKDSIARHIPNLNLPILAPIDDEELYQNSLFIEPSKQAFFKRFFSSKTKR